MKIAGKDFRQRAVAAYQSGEFTREEVAKMFGYTTIKASEQVERADIVQALEEWRRVQDETPCELGVSGRKRRKNE